MILKFLYRVGSWIPGLDLYISKFVYRWNHTYLDPLAMVDGLPFPCFPSRRWITKVLDKVAIIIENHLRTEVAEAVGNLSHNVEKLKLDVERDEVDVFELFELVGETRQLVRQSKKSGNRPQSLDDYAELFKAIELPPVAANYQDDATFAAMRVAGPNPVMLCRKFELLNNFPLTEEQYRSVMPDDTLESALNEGRVYFCDYQALETLTESISGPKKYLYAPVALFAVDRSSDELIPVAIQCQQIPAQDNPVYLADGSVNWLIAKSIVEMADGNYHEAVTHLGMTHLLIEPFIVATARNLPERHPVRKLLWPHFEGNIFINYAAIKTLINSGGIVEQLLNGKLDSILKMSVEGLFRQPFNDVFLPETFINRDVMDLKYYPYRDDSMLYWEAIKNWVSAYLAISYNREVINDGKLQNWVNDLLSESGGRVKGFGQDGRIADREYLIDALTMIIYTASVQHAAVNFPQYEMMSYCPNMPLAAYTEFPEDTTQTANWQDYMDILPDMDLAELQLSVTYLLGSVHYTELGQYDDTEFSSDISNGPLRQFQRDLKEIGVKIKQSNQQRRPYTTLLPECIPQSINI